MNGRSEGASGGATGGRRRSRNVHHTHHFVLLVHDGRLFGVASRFGRRRATCSTQTQDNGAAFQFSVHRVTRPRTGRIRSA